jgi:hypothetical protein
VTGRPRRSAGVKGLPKAARVCPRALDAENDVVKLRNQAMKLFGVTLICHREVTTDGVREAS